MSLKEQIQKRQNLSEKKQNPAQYFLKWNNGSGEITYYDKEKGKVDKEKGKVNLGNNISFLLLDQLSTAKGWDQINETNIIGTEVRNPQFEPIILRSYKDGKASQVAKGIWKTEIKDKYPVDFYASLYIITIIDEKPVLANLQVKGACLASLFVAKLRSVDEFWITFKKGEEQKNGMAKWFDLTIQKTTEVPKIVNDVSLDYYNELQDYLEQYLSKKPTVLTGGNEPTFIAEENSPRPTEEEMNEAFGVTQMPF